ncbi:MAG: DNA-binding protein [Bacteroidaceae bacterium]|nr:DNA-binding protein [Bacteroidaceae bacterium]
MIDYAITIMGTKPGTKKSDITETKAYGTAQVREVLTLDAFAKHITDHGCAYDKGDVVAIITKAVKCLREQMLAGNKVILGDLGGFYPELQTEGSVLAEDFSTDNILAVNVRWLPGKDFKNLRQDATFQLMPTRAAQTEATKEIKNQETIQGME